MFFETIKLLNGELFNLNYHQERLNRTLRYNFPGAEKIDLSCLIPLFSGYNKGLHKVRVDYGEQITKISIDPYHIKTHVKMKILDVGNFDYSFKFSDRTFFSSKLSENPDFDDILLTQYGYLTDTTYCNIALFNGLEWFTPNTFLLPGTKRNQLLTDKKITERNITLKDLSTYREICFINAMRDFEKRYTFVLNQDEILLNEL